MGPHNVWSLCTLVVLVAQLVVVESSPLAAAQQCALVNDILAIIHLPIVSAEATKFCSSYIHIPLVTSTIISTTVFTPAVVTTSTTETEPRVTTTATSRVTPVPIVDITVTTDTA